MVLQSVMIWGPENRLDANSPPKNMASHHTTIFSMRTQLYTLSPLDLICVLTQIAPQRSLKVGVCQFFTFAHHKCRVYAPRIHRNDAVHNQQSVRHQYATYLPSLRIKNSNKHCFSSSFIFAKSSPSPHISTLRHSQHRQY